ncbi:MAG: M50 family metallopeptidase [Patescibacteria group bacterium]|nr:M50 family metallopeptidase [Patescibacteria group bacterium]
MLLTIIAFIFVFGVVVFAHELGHFLSARRFGVKVEEFALGIPPRVFAKKKGDTIYALNLIPIGGYVRLAGEDGKKDNSESNLLNKKAWQRVTIFAAGVLFNFITAYLLLVLFYTFGGRAIIAGMWDYAAVENTQRVIITEVEKDSPAAIEGIEGGDAIISVNGEPVYLHQTVFGAIQADSDKSLDLVIERNGQEFDKNITTYTDTISIDGEEVEAERVGVVLETTGKIKTKWYMAPIVAAQEFWHLVKLSVSGVWDFVRTLFTTFTVSDQVGGPVAIAQITGAAASLGFAAVVQIIILLNIILGVFNILPFPALDGGHIATIGFEKLTGKEIPNRTKEIINFVGFALLLLLVLVVTWGDLGRIGVIEKIKDIF